MREVHFFKLTRPIQDRFVSATRGELPAPLSVTPSRSILVGALIAIAGLGIAAETALLVIGYGDLHSRYSTHPTWMSGVQVGLLALSAACLGAWLVLARRKQTLPFRPHLYLFAACVVDASRAVLRVYDASDYGKVEASGNRVAITSESGRRFEFPAKNAARAEEFVDTIRKAQSQLAKAREDHNRRELAMLDPLVDSGFSSPFSPQTPLVPVRTLGWWMMAAAALGVGAFLGLSAWKLRNTMSERALYAAAVRLDKPAAYRAYLARVGLHDEIQHVLLPRAELREVHASGSLKAIEAYEASHSNSRIQAEVDAVHRDLLLKELNVLMKRESPKALAEFERNSRRIELVAKELGYAKQGVYTSAHKKFLEVAADPQGDVARFVTKALAYARQHGPTVQLRFRRRMAGGFAEMEKAVIKSRYYFGLELLPKNYFREEDARRREARFAEAFLPELQRHFSPEILGFELGPAIAQDAELPAVTCPTIFVDRRVQLSGLFPNLRPRGIFVGMGVLYDVELLIPGDAERVALKFSTWKQPDRKALENSKDAILDVYEVPMNTSFDKFAEWLLPKFYNGAKK